MAKLTKRQKVAAEMHDKEKHYPLAEAGESRKAKSGSKDDETVEIAMNLGVDPKHADQMVRGVCN